MNLRQIEYFLAISETMNFTKAAQKLYVSQTAVTKQIQLLEHELGTQLFDRNNKQIELTKAGEFFLVEAQKIFYQFKHSTLNMKSFLNGDKGIIKIGFLKNLDPKLLVNIFSKFTTMYPLVDIKVSSYANYQLYQELEKGKIDLAFGLSSQEFCNYKKIFIKKYPLIVLINKNNPLANLNTISQEELTNILFDVRKLYLHDDYPEFEGNLLKISCNQGCAILHAFTKDNCYNDYLKAVPLKPRSEKSIYLIYDDKTNNPIVNNFISFISTNKSLFNS